MWLELLKSSIEEGFSDKLEQTISGLGLSIKDFAREGNIPESTLYKIISGNKDFRISTLKAIIETLKRREELEHKFTIAIITTREALEMIGRSLDMDGTEVRIKEYPATTIEEQMIRGVTAEKEGVKGIICGPIAATTLEKIVDIPVVGLQFEERLLMDAINKLMKKV